MSLRIVIPFNIIILHLLYDLKKVFFFKKKNNNNTYMKKKSIYEKEFT